jgi:FkbM family methyltransferase
VKRTLQKLLNRAGYRIEGIRYTPRHLVQGDRLRTLEIHDVICRHMFEHGQDCTFIQVGAYDGVSTDPLHRYIGRCQWRGVMLEPQPRPAEALRNLYAGNDRIVIMEAAIDEARGSRALFTVDSDELPRWAGGMASFDRDHLLKHDYLLPGIERFVRELKVDCVTFADVLAKLPGRRLDLLQIDAEGADGHILSLFPFNEIEPAIIHWEAKNMDRAQQEQALDLLTARGYLVAPSGGEDMLAVRADKTQEA